VLTELGEVLCETGDWPDAQAALERRLALPADGALRAHLSTLLGTALAGAGDAEAALARFLEARDWPRSTPPTQGRDVLERLDRLGEAVTTCGLRRARRGQGGGRLLRPQLELRRGTRGRSQALLHRAASPRLGRGWRLLAGLAASQGRTPRPSKSRPRASGSRRRRRRAELCDPGHALEASDRRRGRRLRLGGAPPRGRTALAAARLLRGAGWRAAAGARALRRGPRARPGGSHALSSSVAAGRWEDVPGAVGAYRALT
jgi:hypothetical protein